MRKVIGDGRQWRGYTLDELRYERSVMRVRMELEKERIGLGCGCGFDSLLSRVSLGRVAALWRYADFAALGVKLWRRVAPLFVGRKRCKRRKSMA